MSFLFSLSVSDLFGLGVRLAWGTYALWVINKMLRSEDTLASLFTTWPGTRRREFRIWLAMSALVLGGLYMVLSSEDRSTLLARRHETAEGTFVKYGGQHAQFDYTFTVQGRTYQGYGSSHQHQLEDIESGAPFTVYYDPINPNINAVSEPNQRSTAQKINTTFFGILFMGVLALVVRKLGALNRTSATACGETTQKVNSDGR